MKNIDYNGSKFKVRAYENIIYVKNPIDTTYQKINIYIPDDYFKGKRINGYSADNAPIFLPNEIGGYMPARPGTLENMGIGGMPPINGEIPKELLEEFEKNGPPQGMHASNKKNTITEALLHGYVVASPGARGRTLKTGKAPASIIDLKAAVRYLKFNNKRIPGNTERIISNGTSAGGAMSALLGASGNNPDYEKNLAELGAASGKDNIFAVSAYCPITNLDHADTAYEWQFYGHNTYTSGFSPNSSGNSIKSLTNEQITASKELNQLFPEYLNNLGLKDEKGKSLSLDKDGNGSFKDLVKSYVILSANKAIEDGQNLSVHKWLIVNNKKVTDLDWNGYISYMQRQKTPPAFDALDSSSPENQEFGSEETDKKHFTSYSLQHSLVKDAEIADSQIIKMMNPVNYIGRSNTNTSKYWRIRHGSKDKDGSLATPIILSMILKNKGYDVDLFLPWDKPHSGDYDLEDLFSWIDNIVKLN